MIDALRELYGWCREHAGILFLTTVGAYSQLSYDLYGPPAHLVVLPSLAVATFFVLPLWGSVLHDTRDRAARGLATAAVAAAMAPVLWWSYVPGGKEAFKADPRFLLAGAVAGAGLVAGGMARGGVAWGDWGLGRGDVAWWRGKVGVLLAALAIGIPLTVAVFPEFAEFYPRYKPARTDVVELFKYELAMAVYMFCWEFYYRGFLLFGLARTIGPLGAILVQAYPFFLLHQHKPEPEMISSWFGGILVGWLCWRSRCMWPAFLLHTAQYTMMELSAFVVRNT